MINCDLVLESLSAYDPDAHEADVLKAEEQRAAFAALFPKKGWPTMTLDRYALGQTDHPDNFCHWMEFVAVELGSIKGGSARKHIIYFQAAAREWWFDRKSYATVDEAWNAVREGFIKAIELAEAGEWDAIETIAPLRPGRALVNKTLSAYFPDELLPINSQDHLRHFLRQLGDLEWNNTELGTIRLNRRLLKALRECQSLSGWTTKQMERLLYSSELSPLIAPPLAGPITDVAAFIVNQLTETGADERLERRREAEDEARRLLDDFAGTMTEE
jgi:5-methylcytosine-specific restriction protein B